MTEKSFGWTRLREKTPKYGSMCLCKRFSATSFEYRILMYYPRSEYNRGPWISVETGQLINWTTDVSWIALDALEEFAEALCSIGESRRVKVHKYRSRKNPETQTRPQIKVYRCDLGKPEARGRMPRRATDGAAGFDLRSTEKVRIEPGARALVSTGLYMEIPRGYHMEIRSRSGVARGFGLTVLNSPGTVDSDYRGEISVLLYNTGSMAYHVDIGERIAQAVVMRHEEPEFIEVESMAELSETVRGGAGFGSTGRI